MNKQLSKQTNTQQDRKQRSITVKYRVIGSADQASVKIAAKPTETKLEIINRAVRKVFGEKASFWLENGLKAHTAPNVFFGKIVKSVKIDQHCVIAGNTRFELVG